MPDVLAFAARADARAPKEQEEGAQLYALVTGRRAFFLQGPFPTVIALGNYMRSLSRAGSAPMKWSEVWLTDADLAQPVKVFAP